MDQMTAALRANPAAFDLQSGTIPTLIDVVIRRMIDVCGGAVAHEPAKMERRFYPEDVFNDPKRPRSRKIAVFQSGRIIRWERFTCGN